MKIPRVSETSLRLRQMSVRSSIAFPGKSGKADYSDEWYTPPHIVQALGAFDLDPSAGPMDHAKHNIRWPEQCGLESTWFGRVWLNPPYSNVHLWLEKFIAHGNGIALVNARPETLWFQRLVANSTAIQWLRGRVQFQRPEGPSKHPTVGSVLVAYGIENAETLETAELPGIVTNVISVNS